MNEPSKTNEQVVEPGSCWVANDADAALVEVTDVSNDHVVSFVVLCAGGAFETEGYMEEAAFQERFLQVRDVDAEMRELYEQADLSVREIAAQYGVSSYTAYYRLKGVGTRFRKSGVRANRDAYERSQRREANLATVVEHYRAGIAVVAIARKMGLSRSRIYQLIRSARKRGLINEP